MYQQGVLTVKFFIRGPRAEQSNRGRFLSNFLLCAAVLVFFASTLIFTLVIQMILILVAMDRQVSAIFLQGVSWIRESGKPLLKRLPMVLVAAGCMIEFSCTKKSLRPENASELRGQGTPGQVVARFENAAERAENVPLKILSVPTTLPLPPEYQVFRYEVDENRLMGVLDDLRRHLQSQQSACDERSFQPGLQVVKNFLTHLESYLETRVFPYKQVILGRPTFRLVNERINRCGGNVHIDSMNVPRDFFRDDLIFKAQPQEPLPYKLQDSLLFDRTHGDNPRETLRGNYYNIWFNLYNKSDEKSGLIFGIPPQLSELKDGCRFRRFLFRDVTTLKVIDSDHWRKMTWLKPAGLTAHHFLLFPTRSSPHVAIDPLTSDLGVHRASVEVRIAVFDY